MLLQPIALHDIANCEAFVRDTLAKSALPFDAHELEEMVAEGLLILVELSSRYQPRLDGYAQDGRFSGYAARYLPRRLGDAWHKRHPEHRRTTDPDGRRRWRYDAPPVSLDLVLSPRPSTSGSGDNSRYPENRLRGIHDFLPVAAAA